MEVRSTSSVNPSRWKRRRRSFWHAWPDTKPRWGLSLCGIECVSLGHVNQVEQRAANARDGRDGVSRLLKRHGAGGDFVQAVINRTGLVHIGEWHVDRDRAVAAGRHQAVRGRQLGDAGICQGHPAAHGLRGVLASKALYRGAVERLAIDKEILSTIRIRRGWNEPLGQPD